MNPKIIALTAVSALALPVAAQADKPTKLPQGAGGGAKKAEKAPKPKPAKKAKGVGFTVAGTTAATALPVADGALTGPLTLDPASANKHARTVLTLTKADLAGTSTEDVGVAGDAVEVEYVGLAEGDALAATDVVKVVGKVARTGKGKAKTLGAVDIRRIVVTRTS